MAAAPGTSDLGSRILYGIPAAAFAIFIVYQGEWWFAAGAIVLGLICMHELFAMFADVSPARLAGFLGLIGLGVAAMEGDQFQIVLVAVAVFPVLFLMTISGPSARGGTFVGDTGAYFVGRAIGRTKLAPRISPNKTIEGLAGGILTAILAVWIVNWYQDWIDTPDALILGAAVAVLAPIGDLFESFIKRDAGTKDTGTLFGAHGGALDRLDAVLFTLVAGYYVWSAIGV